MNDTPKQSPRPFTHKVSKKRVGVFEIDENSICDAKGDILIAENYVPNYHCDCEGYVISLAPGDWHLFAAAPEMLEALKALAQHVESCHCIDPSEETYAWALAKAVIAKAEGEQV